MTLKELYQAIEGDYDDVMGRLPSESLVKKFVIKFLDDKSYELLESSLQNKDFETAFRAAHTLKGVCQNLSFTKLYKSSNTVTDSLRPGQLQTEDVINTQFSVVKQDYDKTFLTIKAYAEQA